jgi:hypothetical protein
VEIVELPIGRNPEETVRLVLAFKFVDEHGEVSTSLLLHSHAMCPHLSSRVARALCRLPRGSPAARFALLPGKATMMADRGSHAHFKTLPQ